MSKENEDFQKLTNDYANGSIEMIGDMVKKARSKNEEKAEAGIEEIHQDPLEIATGKEFDGTRTYMILLGWGGPASRIIGELDEHDQPETAKFQFQDWFKPWTTANTNEKQNEIMLEYAGHFYFERGEND